MRTLLIIRPSVWGVILTLQMLLALGIRYSIFTEKFFIDSLKILSITQSGYLYEGSFYTAARFFSSINFFNVDTLLGWSVYIMLIFFFINIYILKDIRKINISVFFLLILGVFLWYLFAAGITKEVVQTVFYISIYFFCVRNIFVKQIFGRVLIGVFILLICALFFREYYILTAFYSLVLYFAFKLVTISRLQKYNPVILLMCVCVVVWFAVLLGAKTFFEPYYDLIINLRSTNYFALQDNTDSFIMDLVENASGYISVYIINYIVNFIRLMFPFELLLIGKLYYIPFIIYMVFLSVFLYKKTKNITELNRSQLVSLIFIWSFLVVSPTMEPDFGSWARHQSVCWMLVKNLI